MTDRWQSLLQVGLPAEGQHEQLAQVAARRNWGLALILVGWLHLVAFSFCYYVTIVRDYHEPAPYVSVWVGELLGMWALFRICGGARPADLLAGPLERVVRRVWIAYFLLAFNLGSLNTLRGHRLFEFFPAFATLASFAFIVMTVLVNWRFMGPVLLMFASGLLMAAFLLHAFLIFALAWWVVLNGIGVWLWRSRRDLGTAGMRLAARRSARAPAAGG